MRILLIALLLIPLVATGQKMISWESGKQLKWKDFKGRTVSTEHADAYSKVIFGFELNGSIDDGAIVKTQAHFDTKGSWVRPTATTKALLKHEQLHFDICEIYRRKFIEEIQGIKKFSFDHVIDSLNEIFDRLFNEMESFQDKYDHETDHSRVVDKQLVWEQKVEQMVKDTDHLEASDVSIVLY